MRDMMPKKDLVTDPVTGSTLIYRGLSGGREGGAAYRFEYRKNPMTGPIGFYALITTYTTFMQERYCQKRGFPIPNILKDPDTEWSRGLAEFAEAYGNFHRVQEWYLIGPDGRALAGPPEAQRTWAGFALDEAQKIIDTFYRLYFELTSRRPVVTSDDPAQRYYPDLLKFEPYNLPKQLIQERRAAPSEEI
jgi:hypothetical protein